VATFLKTTLTTTFHFLFEVNLFILSKRPTSIQKGNKQIKCILLRNRDGSFAESFDAVWVNWRQVLFQIYNRGFSKTKFQTKHSKKENEISRSMKRIYKWQLFVNINKNSFYYKKNIKKTSLNQVPVWKCRYSFFLKKMVGWYLQNTKKEKYAALNCELYIYNAELIVSSCCVVDHCLKYSLHSKL
jgi:hypothetical protein